MLETVEDASDTPIELDASSKAIDVVIGVIVTNANVNLEIRTAEMAIDIRDVSRPFEMAAVNRMLFAALETSDIWSSAQAWFRILVHACERNDRIICMPILEILLVNQIKFWTRWEFWAELNKLDVTLQDKLLTGLSGGHRPVNAHFSPYVLSSSLYSWRSTPVEFEDFLNYFGKEDPEQE